MVRLLERRSHALKKLLILSILALVALIAPAPAAAGTNCDTWRYAVCIMGCARAEHRCSMAHGDYDNPGSGITEICLVEEEICQEICEGNGNCLPFALPSPNPTPGS